MPSLAHLQSVDCGCARGRHAALRGSRFSVLEPNRSPRGIGPQSLPKPGLGVEHRAVVGIRAGGECRGAPSSTMRPLGDHEHAIEAGGLADVVRDADQRRARHRSRARRSNVARLSRSSPRNGSSRIARRAGARPRRAAEPHALSFAAGEERAPFAERRLQSVGQLRDDARRSASATRAPRPAGARCCPKSRLSTSERFHNWTAGSIHAVSPAQTRRDARPRGVPVDHHLRRTPAGAIRAASPRASTCRRPTPRRSRRERRARSRAWPLRGSSGRRREP